MTLDLMHSAATHRLIRSFIEIENNIVFRDIVVLGVENFRNFFVQFGLSELQLVVGLEWLPIPEPGLVFASSALVQVPLGEVFNLEEIFGLRKPPKLTRTDSIMCCAPKNKFCNWRKSCTYLLYAVM